MYTLIRRRLRGMLFVCSLLGWASAHGTENDPIELLEKYGLYAGMKVTKENAHLVKDLIPQAVSRRLMAGEYVITIGKLDPPDGLTKVWPADFYQASEQNVGKYDLDGNSGIMDKATGGRPWPLPYGLPFPRLDLTGDPTKIGAKIHWNNFALNGMYNEVEVESWLYSSPARGGPDHYVGARGLAQFIDFRRDPINIGRPLSFQEINLLMSPADIFGTAFLTWRWADPKKWDSVWIYSPAIRRVRRASSANRSDGVSGVEIVMDDPNGYAGKIEAFEWKYIGKKAMLMPFLRSKSQAPTDVVVEVPAEAKPSSRYPHVPGAFESEQKVMTFAYRESPQQYASWWAPDFLWVLVSAYVVEGFPKDPYYNYGRQIFWHETHTFNAVWKEVYTRSGEYWRTLFLLNDALCFDTPGKKTCANRSISAVAVDEKSNRGTVVRAGINEQGWYQYNLGVDPDMFSLGRFLEFGK